MNKETYLEKLHHINTFIFDVDGVLTDGTIILTPDGDYIRSMNIKDGYAMQAAIKAGYRIAVISAGRLSEGVKKRLENLGLTDIYLGVSDKKDAYTTIMFSYHLKAENIAYMGDDLPDYEVMNLAGLASCPADAAPEIQNIAHYISPYNGGKGCVRDIIEKVMRLHNKWNKPVK
jgi:3-deoxy-D-manno-octulosonate 8-phosphate phosphatase (KDO 8-P phosphatase)